jgi:hypothetical protein
MRALWVSRSECLFDGPYADGGSVLSVKGKKVLHIDRNDHYGGYEIAGSLDKYER